MICPYHIGQPLVCICHPDDWEPRTEDAPVRPEFGGVYIVRGMEPYRGRVFLEFREIQHQWDQKWFRPAVDFESMISIKQKELV